MIRARVEGSPHHLPESDKNQGRERKEEAGEDFDRNDEVGRIFRTVLSAEKNLLGRSLTADIHHDQTIYEVKRKGCHERRTIQTVSGITVLFKSCFREAAKHPTDIPRKQAISTRFVKKVKKITMLPNQRMHVNSKKRIPKLMMNKSNRGFDVKRCKVGASILGDDPFAMLPALKR